MPIHEFKCGNCEKTFELLYKTALRDMPKKCPLCKTSGQLKKLISSCHFFFKGGLPSYLNDDSGEEWDETEVKEMD